MTQQHDSESKNRRLTEKAKPASVGRVLKLELRIAELEKAVDRLIAADCEPLQQSEW